MESAATPGRAGPPAGPRPSRGAAWVPKVGQALLLFQDPLGGLDRNHRERGDLYRLEPGPRLRNWIVNRPSEIERILTSPHGFRRDADVRRLRDLLGMGLLTSEGELWKRQRRLMQPAFHRERVAGYARITMELACATLDAWGEGPRDLHHDVMGLTLRVVSAALFGDGQVDAEEVASAMELVSRRFSGVHFLMPSWFPTPTNWRYGRAISRLDASVRGLIARRRAHGGAAGEDLLSLLLHAQDEDGTKMTDAQVRDEVITLLLAGHETTANALSWSGHLLSLHPEVAERLHEEVAALGGPPSFADLPRLRYAEAVLQESMRLYPPVWAMGREVAEPYDLDGSRLRAGDQVTFSQWVVHRDERWYRDALAFRPERWLDGSLNGLPPYAYFPFGGGQRMCIGKSFAMMEGVLVLAELVRRFRLHPVPGFTVELMAAVTLRPRHGLMLNLERRAGAALRPG